MNVQVMVTHPTFFHRGILRKNWDVTNEWEHGAYAFDLKVTRMSLDADRNKFPDRIDRYCWIRNTMLDLHLDPKADVVLWLDADIVEFQPEFFFHLVHYVHMKQAIIAPSIILEGKAGWWYDTWGFVKNEKFFTHEAPYFQGPRGPEDDEVLVQVESVGCLYAMPAKPLHAGVRYTNVKGHTDHMGICQAYRDRGIHAYWDSSMWACHADLAAYGLSFH
jgi:hypothetical protein